MRVRLMVVSAAFLVAAGGCQSTPEAPPPTENVVQPLGLEEVTIVSKGLE